ncbi:fibronectin-binding protein A N-terminus-domain-containing protein [Mucor lusitanicus]
MKQRFNALDVRATVINLRERLIGIRLQNIYDVNNKTFLFKFAKPDDKELVLVESGIRIHTTQFSRDKSVTPTPFCAKADQPDFSFVSIFVRRRVTNVRQLGVDRIVDFEFAGGENGIGYHIICEFYSSQSGQHHFHRSRYRILALLRNVPATDTLNIAVGEIYNIQTVLTDFEKVQVEYGPAMIEHMILEAGLDPNMKVATDFDTSEHSPMVQALLEGFNKGDELIESTKNVVPNGYIVLLDEKNKPKTESEEQVEIYDEFHPFLYKQFANRQFKEYPSFDKAVDEFFSAIESQKLELKSRRQEEAALKKLEAVRREQENRVQSLLDQQITNVRKAQLIELNLQMVDAAITIIRNAVAMLGALYNEIDTNTVFYSDPEEYEDSDDSDDSEAEDAAEQKSYKVDYYEQKKTTATKHEKTIEATSKALKSAERKIRQDLKETKITATINKIRKPFWFEKFLWFISTDGHLVIAGRDMQQNEMLVKRYLLKDDAYVHADLHGAASVIVKNKPNANGQPIPPSTLYQAGIMSVCQSKAWDSKIVTSAYWVYPDQKNFLPPVQLVYGFGYVFKLDESSIGNHVKSQSQQEDGEGEDATAEGTGASSGKADFLDSIEEKKPEEGQTDAAESTEKETVEVSATTTTTSGASTPEVNEAHDQSASESDSDSDDSSDDDEHAFPDTQLESLPVKVEKAQEKDAKADKYDLDDYGHDSDEQNDAGSPSTNGSNTPAKKFITAKERRLMKKNNLTEITDAIKEQQQLQQQQAKQKQAKPKQAPAKPKTVVAPPASTRGKKGKAKKMKDKYADQDEEERQLRMELWLVISYLIMTVCSLIRVLSPRVKSKRDAKAKEDKAALEKERAAKKEADEKARLLKKQQQEEEEQQEKEHPIETEGVDAKDTETIRQMLKEENITMLEADEIANLSVLDSLTPNPLPEDIIHFAIPVCAPYTAIQKYKYKRGKAIKQAQSVFFNLNEATAREKELIKSVPEMEGINTMMSKVKVSAPNLEASKRKKGGNRR